MEFVRCYCEYSQICLRLALLYNKLLQINQFTTENTNVKHTNIFSEYFKINRIAYHLVTLKYSNYSDSRLIFEFADKIKIIAVTYLKVKL